MKPLTQVALGIQEDARRLAHTFRKPDDDWPGAQFYFLPESEKLRSELVHPDYLGSPEARDNLAAHMATKARALRAVYAALLHGAYSLELPADTPKDKAEYTMAWCQRHGVRNHPLHVESLVLLVISRTDAAVYRAIVERSPDSPPTLGEWIEWVGEGKTFESRFLPPVQRALAVAHN